MLNISKREYGSLWQRRTHTLTDIKPTHDSGIWFGKSKRKIENALYPVILIIIYCAR